MIDASEADEEQGLRDLRVLVMAYHELSELRGPRQNEEACRIVAERAAAATGSRCAVRRYDPSTETLTLIAAAGEAGSPPPERVPAVEGLHGLAARQRRLVVLTDAPPAEGARSLAVVPILGAEVYYGNLSAAHPDPGHFLKSDVALLEGLSLALGATLRRLEAVGREAELERSRAEAELFGLIGQMSYGLLHRLNNDIGLIPSYVREIRRALESDEPTERIEKYLAEISHAAKNVLKLSEQIRNEVTSSHDEDASPVSVPVLLAEVRKDLRDPPGVALAVEVEDGLPPVSGSARDLADILRNLAVNAIEAMPQGGVLTLRARREGGQVAIEVEDTGPGIAESALGNIFKLGFSTKASSGFGLWSAKSKAKKNGGDLRIASRLGQGSVFTLSLPAAESRKA